MFKLFDISIIIAQHFDDFSQFYWLIYFELDNDDTETSKLYSILRYLLSNFIFQMKWHFILYLVA